MRGFLYGVALQFKLDIRSKSLLITCYMVPLMFFSIMGGIFTAIDANAKYSLIQTMTVLGVSTGAIMGLPPSLVEVYGSDIKKVYKVNGVPMYLGLVSIFLSTFLHLLIMCAVILLAAPIVFDAVLPPHLPLYIGALAIFIAVSLSVGSVLGLMVKSQAKLMMISQVIFLPSIMLSGIMFPAEFLPRFLEVTGRIFPAAWGYKMMMAGGFNLLNLWPLLVILLFAVVLCGLFLRKIQSE